MPRLIRQLKAQTSIEHASIDACLGPFEAALNAPASKGSATWRRRLRRELRPLATAIEEHIESAESERGLLPHIEVTLGRNRVVSNARRLHTSATRQADELLESLRDAAFVADHDDLSKKGGRLASTLRRHHILEGDLLLMAVNGATGTGD